MGGPRILAHRTDASMPQVNPEPVTAPSCGSPVGTQCQEGRAFSETTEESEGGPGGCGIPELGLFLSGGVPMG